MSYRHAVLGYVIGGLALSAFGPPLLGVAQPVATIAATAAMLLFAAGHLIVHSHTRLRALQARVAELDQRFDDISIRIDAHDSHLTALPPAHMMEEMRQTLAGVAAALAHRPETDRVDARCNETGRSNKVVGLVRNAIAHSGVDLYLQAIVQLPSRNVVHYEAFSRVRDEGGRVVMPAEFLPAVEAAGLAAALDNMQLARCVTLARRLGRKRLETRIFCNVAGPALADARFTADLASFLRENDELAARLVFEIAARDVLRLSDSALTALARIGQAGFGFSIDGYRAAVPGLDQMVARLGTVRFVKIDADTLLASSGAPVARFERDGINLVATRVEHERQVVELLDLGVRFGQGYLFGHPRPARLDNDPAIKAARAA